MRRNSLKPQYADFVVADGKIWYSSCLMNGLFCQPAGGGKSVFVGSFPDEDIWSENLHRRVILAGRTLIFVPFCARHISIYHLDCKRFEKFDVPDAETMAKYVSAVLLERLLYLFPACAKKAIVFDVERKTVSELKEFNEELDCLTDHTGQKFYLTGTVSLEDSIYLAIKDTDQLIQYFYKEGIFSRHSLDLDGGKLGSLAADQNNLYIGVSGKNDIICRDMYGKEKRLVFQLPEQEQQTEISDFPIMKCCRGNIFLHFMGQNVLYKMDTDSMKVNQIILTKENQSLYLMKQEREELFFLPCEGHPMHRYQIEEGKAYEMPMIPENRNTLIGKSLWALKTGVTFYESEDVSLEDYTEMMLESGEQTADKSYSGAGEKIWEEVRACNHI